MIDRSQVVSRPNPLSTHSTPRLAKRKVTQSLAHAARVMAPTFVALTFASVAHAQGTMDFSGAQTLMGTFNDRLAYVAISRASDDARIYTNDAETLGQRLATDITKTAAVEMHTPKVLDQTAALLRSNFTPEIEFEGFALSI